MSDRPVKKELWEFWLGGMPMPEGATFDQMWAAYDVTQKIDDREYAASQILWYEEMLRRTTARQQELEADGSPEALEKLRYVTDSVKLINEGIEFWREELSE